MTAPFPFRAITAPSSLKLVLVLLTKNKISPLPGHNCPGLIEAPLFKTKVNDLTFLPGHNCPGLIEANATSSCVRPSWSPSGA